MLSQVVGETVETAFPGRSPGSDPLLDRPQRRRLDAARALLNPLPKVVVSRTLSEPLEWNARLLRGELGEAVPRLKDELDGDLIVSGCGELARNLLAEGLVDELRFWVHPAVWGDGARPFEGETVRMRLLDSKAFDSGVTLLRYEELRTG